MGPKKDKQGNKKGQSDLRADDVSKNSWEPEYYMSLIRASRNFKQWS